MHWRSQQTRGDNGYCRSASDDKEELIDTERDVGEMWKQALQQSMLEAGRRKREIAIQKGHFHKCVPAITVIVDGGWSKRSHKHSYNAKSGVAIIIGKETGKLLHIGVRNKFCHACARKIPKENHTCYRNWGASSSEMETDIILEGFLEAERVHRVRYTEFIGDGDSSVHPTLIQKYQDGVMQSGRWNVRIMFASAIMVHLRSNPSYKGSGGLTVKMRKRLVSTARSAIRMRNKDKNRVQALV